MARKSKAQKKADLLRTLLSEFNYSPLVRGWESAQKALDQAAQAVVITEELLEANELLLLGQVLVEVSETIISDEELQGSFICEIDAGRLRDIYLLMEGLAAKEAIADLIHDYEPLRALLLDAWRRGDEDEAAMLYGSAYLEWTQSEARAMAMEVPLPLLQLLLARDWPRDYVASRYSREPDGKHQGIKEWLRVEIEELTEIAHLT